MSGDGPARNSAVYTKSGSSHEDHQNPKSHQEISGKKKVSVQAQRLLEARYAKKSAKKKTHHLHIGLVRERNKLYLNLIALEKDYVNHLGNLNKFYMAPLKKKMAEPKPLITSKEFGQIFSNMEEISALHGKFVLKLEDLALSWPIVDGGLHFLFFFFFFRHFSFI